MTDEQTAAEIMKSLWIKTRRDSAGKSMDYWIGGTFRGTVEEAMKDRADIEAAIVRALQAARESAIDTHANAAVLRMCHEARMMNGIVDYSDPKAVGVVRRVLGHLAITKDGWVIGDDCRVWQDGQMWNTELFRVPTESNGRWSPYRTNKVYSSEAAEAAKEGKA